MEELLKLQPVMADEKPVRQDPGQAMMCYLYGCKEGELAMDLSACSVTECIRKKCEYAEKPGLWRNYRFAIRHLELTEDACGKQIMPWMVTSVFWQLFCRQLTERKISRNSQVTIVHIIRSAIKWASDYGVRLSPGYDQIDIKKVKKTRVALTQFEVSAIYHFNPATIMTWSDRYKKMIHIKRNHIENLTRVRDLFVLSTMLGQRWSDMTRISKDCFDRNKFSLLQKKTENKCHVNLDVMAMDRHTVYEILERYDYKAPYQHDISNYNHLLHELLSHVGGSLNDDVKVEYKVDGMMYEYTQPKWQMIASHCGRRTFCTYNLIANKLSARDVMVGSGHTTETSFNYYICREE